MSGNKLVLTMVFVFCIGGVAFGWAGNTHALLCQRNFDLPVVSQFLGGIDQGAVEGYILEPSEASHNVQWELIANRKYLSTSGACSNGFWLWGLGETDRLQYLMHHAGDVSVPAHHVPAVYEYNSQWAEGLCEAAAAGGYTSVGELPNVANTTSYTHSRNGHSYSFTGTISQVVSTFEAACRDNAAWYKSTMYTIFGRSFHLPSDIASANWNGLAIDLMLQRAVMVDYFLAKQDVVMVPYHFPVGYAGGYIHFDQSDSYDPDAVSWNGDGTYSQIYGTHSQGLQYFYWDVNADVPYGGNWDYGSWTSEIDISVNDLIAMGVPTNQWTPFYIYTIDNEGKAYAVEDYMYLSTGGLPEPATMSLLAVGGLALLRRKK